MDEARKIRVDIAKARNLKMDHDPRPRSQAVLAKEANERARNLIGNYEEAHKCDLDERIERYRQIGEKIVKHQGRYCL